MMTTDWKAEISRVAYWKQLAAERAPRKIFPWHYPRVRATREDILRAEACAAVRFSKDYIDFLLHSNGWKCFFCNTDLFGTPEFLSGRASREIEQPELRAFIQSVGFRMSDVTLIGSSDLELDRFLLVSATAPTSPGQVIWFASEEVDRYTCFSEFFGSMVNYNAGIAEQMLHIK